MNLAPDQFLGQGSNVRDGEIVQLLVVVRIQSVSVATAVTAATTVGAGRTAVARIQGPM